MKTVLILNPTYLPGFRAGGPQQTVKNICDVYGDRSRIFLITKNKDHLSDEEYDLPANRWLDSNNIKVKYLESKRYGLAEFFKAYREFDNIYSCGLFCKNSYELMIIHKIFHRRGKKIYVAPMGVFSIGAMNIKRKKKRLFFLICKLLRLFDDIVLSFSSEKELEDAKQVIGDSINNYIIAEDIPRRVEFCIEEKEYRRKRRSNLNIVFISRISPMKNLEKCNEVLKADYQGQIKFDIYGVKEDEEYWKMCMESAESLPDNVAVSYKGEVKPDDVMSIFRKYDIFLFPTKGENYGHVVFEALASGCLPLISDETSWNDIVEKKCGSVCALDSLDDFRTAIKKYLEMDEDEISVMRQNARAYAKERYNLAVKESGYNDVFLEE